MQMLLEQWVLPTLYACLACIGFTYIFNIHGFIGKLICGVGGGLGWLIYILMDKTLVGAFWAAAAIGVFSEMMARLIHCPATGYLLISLLPLVPGGGIYYAMSYFVQGDRTMFAQTLMTTLSMAAILAVGAMMSSSLFRTLFPRFPHMPRIPWVRRSSWR